MSLFQTAVVGQPNAKTLYGIQQWSESNDRSRTTAPATSRAAVLLVGPEGGLTESEMQLAGECGFEPRSLGVTTLRSEMAVVAGAVLLLQG